MNIFDKYAKNINQDELAASQKEINDNAKGGSGDYEEVPVGDYEVRVDKLECKLSSKGNPMVSIWFKVLKGKFQNSIIFYNGVFKDDWMRHRVVKMISALLGDNSHEAEINLILKSGDVDYINQFCMDVHEQIDGQFEYLLAYGMKKGYNTYSIEAVYEL